MKITKGILRDRILWLGALLLSGCAGYMVSEGRIFTSIVCAVGSFNCAICAIRRSTQMKERVLYIVNAAINGDFSYKFSTANVSNHEKEINTSLNRLVQHIEQLGTDAVQRERFLGEVIDLVDTGIVVANEKGEVVHHNKAALMIMSRPALSHVCQIPDQSNMFSIKKASVQMHGHTYTIYTLLDTLGTRQRAEVESWEKLTRVLTHEIMNTLTPIASISADLQVNPDTDHLEESLATISASADGLMRFVKNFRRFTILPEPQPRVIYVKPMLERAAMLTRNAPGGENVEISVFVTPSDALVYADETMLYQVVVNIMKNALEAHPQKISAVSKIREDEQLEISISNDGDPIPPEIADQIFTPFFTTKPDGSGIGLSLSRRIITRMGGTLSLQQTSVTRFMIVI